MSNPLRKDDVSADSGADGRSDHSLAASFGSSHFIYRGLASSKSTKTDDAETPSTPKESTPAHPHLRPPRKLRQVASPPDTIETPKKPRAAPSTQLLPVVSFCTAHEYRLDDLKTRLRKTWKNGSDQQDGGRPRYQLVDSFLTEELVEDAVHYKISRSGMAPLDRTEEQENEAGDVFIFREGSVVFWNVAKAEAKGMLNVLQEFEVKPYPKSIVEYEAEYLDYGYSSQLQCSPSPEVTSSEYNPKKPPVSQMAKLTSDGCILLSQSSRNSQELSLVKYTFSDAIAMSVKLAIYESLLQQYVSSIDHALTGMKTKGRVVLSKDQVLRKTGELFDLRHSINLSSDMLDTPDFYWDREDLESLYQLMTVYLSINRRTKVMNEKLNHCYAMVEFFRDHLNNQHHVRLELMIIALICVEVFFECLHYAERWLEKEMLFLEENPVLLHERDLHTKPNH
ncbi:hypothetical protein RvY_13473-2 [Ramazzottius varieornatus]|uniref:DUF155 domain-containing protein n=1 Tax=Ramazzottius varieornatus TaxID=947166 RepID=A0A1D1VWI9_RAMVA|nr:hypothetical protein RvY_13473-2 [Ramazzottius varieornatus]